ncbi:MAG: IS1380 family transposase [Candidatus Sulfotelmatobacter sp.]
MNNDITGQSVLFPELFKKPLVAQFDQADGSSDGGAILLKACDERLSLTQAIAACVREWRQPGKVEHELEALFCQRVFGIACGYVDCNDAARLVQDPIQKLLAGRDAVGDDCLASQPTLSRFENAVSRKDLYRMSEALADTVIERHRQRLGRKVKRITIDLDPTDDPTHGAQQLSFFNAYYDTWCYLPTAGFVSFNNEPDQYLFCYVLRAGNATAGVGAVAILKRAVERLRAAFPKVKIRVRLDGGYAFPEMFTFLEAAWIEYVISMAKNSVLKAFAEPLMKQARRLSRQSKQTEHVYGECLYSAGKWKNRHRRVIIKAEVVRAPERDPKDNPRFVVTNLRTAPRKLYERIYCARGEIENRIKELHHGLEIDRTSCTDFWPNQLRCLMTAAAYVIFQELRLVAPDTCKRAQVSTLRERFIKLGVWVQESVRRIVLHFPETFPFSEEWRQIAGRLGAYNTG